jgi:subfamily B ATP-binding cassette protein HlyB/CyaB
MQLSQAASRPKKRHSSTARTVAVTHVPRPGPLDAGEAPLTTVALAQSDWVWLLGSLCHVNRVPFDARLVLQRFPAPHDARQLVEALQSLGFRAGNQPHRRGRLTSLPMPCIAFVADRGTPESDAAAAKPVLIVGADATRVLHFVAGKDAPLTETADAFERRIAGDLILVRHESAAAETGPGDADHTAPFGYRWFARELLRHRRVWRDVLAASLFIQLIGLTTPLFTQVVIDKVVVHQTASTLVAVAIGMAMFLVFSAGMTWLRQYLLLHTGNRVDAVLGSQVFRRLLHIVHPWFETRSTGTLIARVHAVETIRDFMAGAAVSLLLDLPFLLVFLAVMFFYSWQLSLLALGILALIVVASLVVTPMLRGRINRQFLLGARNQAFLTEHVAGIETVKALQMEPRLESRYDELLAQYLAAGFDTRRLSNTYNVAVNALEQAMTLSILVAGALLVMRNDGFTIGMLVAFQMFAGRLSQPVLRLAGLWQEFQQANIAMKRLGDIMDAPAEPHALTPTGPTDARGELRMEGISFRYSDRHPYLYEEFSAAFLPGTLTVITGPSGAGKSTLAKLLLGFQSAERGRILLDGRDTRHMPLNALRGQLGVVPQETWLFSGSITENLIAANPNARVRDVIEACRVAEIHDFIEQLPNGYQTEIGEHGTGLSGGQKQRLAIARALLREPKILLFDEATSSLDRDTAERFARTVNGIKARATILFIAHEIPPGLEVDHVITLGAKTA